MVQSKDVVLYGVRYCGNTETKLFHDLRNEKPECGIAVMVEGGWLMRFDSADDAREQGYTDCPACIGHTPLDYTC